MMTKAKERDFKRLAKEKIKKFCPSSKDKDLYYENTIMGCYLEHISNFPKRGGKDYYMVHLDHNGGVTMISGASNLFPTIRHFQDIYEFEMGI